MFETGVGINNPIFFIGVVERNDDPRLEGRVQVRAFSVHGKNNQVPTTDLPWAVCAAGNFDANNPVPKLNSFVYGMFLDGRDAQHPLILGLIPSQYAEPVDPAKNGWGVVPHKDGAELACGSSPYDFGQPQNSKLARGENIDETYVLAQEMNRVEGAKIAGTDETWDEPPSAYAAKYPHNRVIETSKHSVELDDTPGSERIMIRHYSGSYVQMDASGSVSYKSMKDKADVTLQNENVFVGGKSIVHIHGDSHIYTHGDRTEEVNGDYSLLVRGNAEFGVGGQMNLNASDQVQIRGADVKIEANVSTLTLKAKRSAHIGADESILLHSLGNINQTALGNIDSFATFDYNVTAVRDFNTMSSNVFQTALSAVPSLQNPGQIGVHIKSLLAGQVNIHSSTNVNVRGDIGVSIDNIVNLASGLAAPADQAAFIIPNFPPTGCVMPQPPLKSTALTQHKKSGSSSVGGITTAQDKD